jgi:RNA polymerase sigma factor (sigma-70 family)
MFDKIKDSIIVVEYQLIERMKEADEDAWSEVFERCSRKLSKDIVASLQKRGVDSDHAQDVQQQAWLTVVENIDTFIPEGDHSFYCWLRTISFNHIRNRARKRKADTTLETLEEQSQNTGVSLDAHLFRNHVFVDSPEELIILNEQIIAVFQVLNKLKPRHRDILLRRFFLNQSPKEISKTCGSLKPRSISQLLGRLLKLVRVEYNVMQKV